MEIALSALTPVGRFTALSDAIGFLHHDSVRGCEPFQNPSALHTVDPAPSRQGTSFLPAHQPNVSTLRGHSTLCTPVVGQIRATMPTKESMQHRDAVSPAFRARATVTSQHLVQQARPERGVIMASQLCRSVCIGRAYWACWKLLESSVVCSGGWRRCMKLVGCRCCTGGEVASGQHIQLALPALRMTAGPFCQFSRRDEALNGKRGRSSVQLLGCCCRNVGGDGARWEELFVCLLCSPRLT
ncbi:hypothetical protein DFH27DRAFT_79214 [Peziza echinospora]|nr:hypothetical protein DFH27DRAFT_79214 [Peziza echinospora]